MHSGKNTVLFEEDLLFIDSLFDKYKAEFVNSVMLHGFFTGLICAPTLIMPSRYLPIVWGRNNQPIFDSEEEIIRFHNASNKLWNLVVDNLSNKEPGSFPIPASDKRTLLDWIMGFQYATGCAPDDWQLLAKNEKTSSLLAMIIAIEQKYAEDEDIELDKDDILWLSKAISFIYLFFYDLRMEYASRPSNSYSAISTHSKTGRNELCPCGSGKKYKKCCIDITFH